MCPLLLRQNDYGGLQLAQSALDVHHKPVKYQRGEPIDRRAQLGAPISSGLRYG